MQCLSSVPEENVAHSHAHGAVVLYGDTPHSSLLNGDHKNYDMERGFSRHSIDEPDSRGIIIKLGKQFIINHIRLLLWDKDQRYC